MITIVDNGGANHSSIIFSLNRLGVLAKVSCDANTIKNSTHIIIPGVASAEYAMKRLADNSLIDVIRSLTQPVLGICLGMQILFEFSEEGNVDCLKILPGQIKRLPPSTNLSVPHMGWNRIKKTKPSNIMKNIPNNAHAYYVHSYYTPIGEYTSATSCHGVLFSASVQHKNFYGTQFHPERSSHIGSQLLKNFLEL